MEKGGFWLKCSTDLGAGYNNKIHQDLSIYIHIHMHAFFYTSYVAIGIKHASPTKHKHF